LRKARPLCQTLNRQMTTSQFQSIPKKELAHSQINVALRLYMASEEYPCVITLAGAAEEVLGKIAIELGHEPSFNKTLRELLDMHKQMWGKEAKESDYADLRNKARNEMKHKCSGNDVHLNYEHEAAQMLSRVLENYLLCFGTPHPGQYQFTSKKIANWRAKQ
jgi:hypothetical protein